MARQDLDRILLVEGGRLVGIISEADIRSDEAPLAQAASAARLAQEVNKPDKA
jgi:hypothetical protein